MKLVKQYNIGKNTEFNLEQLNNDLEPGEYTIKTQGVSKNGKKSPESEGVTFKVIGKEVKIGDYTYRTTLVNMKDIVKAGDALIDWEAHPGDVDRLYIERDGRYYFSKEAIEYLVDNTDTIFPGWHIPTRAELDNMFKSVGIDIENVPVIEEVEDSLKEVLNKVGHNTSTWADNSFYSYFSNPEDCDTSELYMLCTSDGYSIMFSHDMEWYTIDSSYWPQIILCKNN